MAKRKKPAEKLKVETGPPEVASNPYVKWVDIKVPVWVGPMDHTKPLRCDVRFGDMRQSEALLRIWRAFVTLNTTHHSIGMSNAITNILGYVHDVLYAPPADTPGGVESPPEEK